MRRADIRAELTGRGLPQTARPVIATGELTPPNQDLDVAGNLALRMMTPSASGQVILLEKAACTTFRIRHAFPRERPQDAGFGAARSRGGMWSVDRGRPQFLPRGLEMPRPSHRCRCGADSTNGRRLCLSGTTPDSSASPGHALPRHSQIATDAQRTGILADWHAGRAMPGGPSPGQMRHTTKSSTE